jgi:hypothetical protein
VAFGVDPSAAGGACAAIWLTLRVRRHPGVGRRGSRPVRSPAQALVERSTVSSTRPCDGHVGGECPQTGSRRPGT